MGWIFDGLEKSKQERHYSDIELFKRSLIRLAPFKKPAIIIVIAMSVGTLISLTTPIIFALVIDGLENATMNDLLKSFLLIGAFSFCIISILQWVIDYTVNIQFAKLVPDFMVTLRGDIFDGLARQDMKFFDKHRSGQLNSRVSRDAGDYGQVVTFITSVIGQIFTLLSIFLVLAFIDLPLALLSACVVPILAIMSILFRKVARSLSRTFRKVHGEINAAIAESVNGIRVSKSFGMENESLEDFKKINQKHYSAGFKQQLAMTSFFPAVELISIAGTLTIIFIGGQSAIQGGLSAGIVYLFISYLARFFFPVTQLVSFYAQVQQGLAAFERILEVIDTEPEIKDEGSIELDRIEGKIEFKNVDFAYVPEQPVLTNFSLTINPGEKLAIVGHTGAGKTSIISLLSRFYEFQKGTVLIDGNNIRDIKLKSYRRHVGVVLQKPFLFHGTVEENIRYGRQEASDEDVLRALKIVKADEIIGYLNDGLKSSVGEGGALLSTGTRQLISFARALLCDPRILILDEATSSVDAYTESIIQESLEELMKNRTSIVIAHRLSTVKDADRIIVIDKGEVIEQGSHEALLKKEGEYANLYNTYFKHQEITWTPTDSAQEAITEVVTNP